MLRISAGKTSNFAGNQLNSIRRKYRLVNFCNVCRPPAGPRGNTGELDTGNVKSPGLWAAAAAIDRHRWLARMHEMSVSCTKNVGFGLSDSLVSK